VENYVTLFDSLFLPQGLALNASLERHGGSYRLWVLCMDTQSYKVLNNLALPNVRPIPIEAVETDALRKVKSERSRGEYCWTLTPFTPKIVFDTDLTIDRVTYLDADFWFCGNPTALFSELERSGKQVLITDHGYATEYDQSHMTGQYCVQFVVFKRDGGEAVRHWWADRCLEWCYARNELGRFGDQKYLERWPIDFPDLVHVSKQLHAFQAPWNAKRFPPSAAVAYHFHGLRLMKNDYVLLTDHYHIPRSTFEIIYKPYLEDLKRALQLLRGIGHPTQEQITLSKWQVRIRAILIRLRAYWRELTRPDITRIS
jgi:hypothetical protein